MARCLFPSLEVGVTRTIRERLVHSAAVGTVAAGIAAALQYFVAIPVGDQPRWLSTLALGSGVPSAYVTLPLEGWITALFRVPLGSPRLVEVATPFGPAFRAAPEQIALVALGTIVIVGLADYLGAGVSEMVEARHA